MPIIETTEDLLRLLDENEEFLTAVRQKILTDELMSLPARFSAFALKTDARLDNIENDIVVLKEDVSVLKQDMGVVKGFSLESALSTKGWAKITGALRLRRTRILRLTDSSRGSEDFTDAMWDAQESGIISQSEYQRILVTDMVIRAERQDVRGTDMYVVVEASYTCDKDDLDRVLLSADVLCRVFPGTEVAAALYFVDIDEDNLSAAQEAGVLTVTQ